MGGREGGREEGGWLGFVNKQVSVLEVVLCSQQFLFAGLTSGCALLPISTFCYDSDLLGGFHFETFRGQLCF